MSCRWRWSQCVAMSRRCRVAKIKIFWPLHCDHSLRQRHGSDISATFLRHHCDRSVKITLKTSDKREVQIRSQKLVIYNVRLYVYGSVQQNMSTSFFPRRHRPPTPLPCELVTKCKKILKIITKECRRLALTTDSYFLDTFWTLLDTKMPKTLLLNWFLATRARSLTTRASTRARSLTNGHGSDYCHESD